MRYRKMEVLLNVKNVPKLTNPTVDSVIVFDGKQWYLTTKESLLADSYKMLDKCKEELENTKRENDEFKKSVAKQLYEMTQLIEKLYINK